MAQHTKNINTGNPVMIIECGEGLQFKSYTELHLEYGVVVQPTCDGDYIGELMVGNSRVVCGDECPSIDDALTNLKSAMDEYEDNYDIREMNDVVPSQWDWQPPQNFAV